MAFVSNGTGIVALDAHLITAYQQIFFVEQENLAKGLDSLVTMQFAERAATFTFPKYSGTTRQTSALTELNDVTPEAMSDTAISVTPAEYGHVVVQTAKVNAQSGGLPYLGAVRVEAKNMVESQEARMIVVGEAGTNELIVGQAAESSITSSNVLTAAYVKRARNKLARVGALKPWSCIIHPDVLHDLMIETGTGAWNEQARYGENVRVFSQQIPEFAGFTFFESPLVTVNTDAGDSAVDTYHTQFFGYNAFVKGVSIQPQLVIKPSGDRLGRFTDIGWYGMYEYSLGDTDFHWVVTSASSIGSNS